jgi:hypothetical protein
MQKPYLRSKKTPIYLFTLCLAAQTSALSADVTIIPWSVYHNDKPLQKKILHELAQEKIILVKLQENNSQWLKRQLRNSLGVSVGVTAGVISIPFHWSWLTAQKVLWAIGKTDPKDTQVVQIARTTGRVLLAPFAAIPATRNPARTVGLQFAKWLMQHDSQSDTIRKKAARLFELKALQDSVVSANKLHFVLIVPDADVAAVEALVPKKSLLQKVLKSRSWFPFLRQTPQTNDGKNVKPPHQ